MKVFTQILEGRSFTYNGHKYSSGFGRYTKDGESITKEEYQNASEKYKDTPKKAVKKINKNKETTISKGTSVKSSYLIDTLNMKSKTYHLLKKYPFKESKSLKSCEELISSFSGSKCSLQGITKKEIYNGCAESLYKVLSKYPQLGDSGCIEYFCTTKGVNKLYVQQHRVSDEELNKILNSALEKLISGGVFAKEGMPISLSLYALRQYGSEKDINKFCKINNINSNDVVNKNTAKLLEEEFKKQLLSYMEKVVSKQSYIKFGSVKNTYALYNPNEKRKGLFFIPSNMQKSIESYDNDLTKGFHCKGTTYKSITTHELGHAMETMLKLDNNLELKNLYLNHSFIDVMNNVSRYATENIHEFIAECFSEYIDSDNPREISKKVGEIIDKEYEKYMIKQYGE